MCLKMMRADEAPATLAASTDSSFPQSEEFRPDKARHSRPGQQAQGHGDRYDPTSVEHVTQDRSDQQHRQRDDQVGESHDHRVDPTAVEPGDGAEHHSDDGGQDAGDHHQAERLLDTAHHLGEVVLAVLPVGSEREVPHGEEIVPARSRRPTRSPRTHSGVQSRRNSCAATTRVSDPSRWKWPTAAGSGSNRTSEITAPRCRKNRFRTI